MGLERERHQSARLRIIKLLNDAENLDQGGLPWFLEGEHERIVTDIRRLAHMMMHKWGSHYDWRDEYTDVFKRLGIDYPDDVVAAQPSADEAEKDE